ncbi:TetR/AcrR family transcriptional regulator [Candidatus Nitronereus thalassa]|uniref:TetR/AcrR family transcriptional regulator n=1 Tax=Candidatus Nitronereus thalassa TaxID=3020898 RepID=A0ABU3KB25_9BACT|nr:TetR/AcrR family transcriptional regulator [Candidatus Nitronereus thalassa]MDT7043623.1 TetR/AcrR family transcriptional regulator [Candidatus Nitronereus thalassa]
MGTKQFKLSKRDQLVQTAVKLFAEHGFHATGVDAIAEKSGVTKRTLYAHFRSKEDLVLAALRHYDGVFRNDFIQKVEESANTPRGRLLAVFDVAEEWFQQNNFYGCMFINAVGEYSERDSAIRQVCSEFKSLVKGYIRELCAKAGAKDPLRLAEELALLFEGAIVTAQVSQNPKAAEIAKRASRALIQKATS